MKRFWLTAALSSAVTVLAAGLVAGCAPAARGVAAAPALGQPAAQTLHYLDLLTRQGRFRGAVLVERAGRVLLRNGFGLADVTHHVPDTPATRFRVASLTKQFTAMAILQLQPRAASASPTGYANSSARAPPHGATSRWLSY